MKKISMEEMQNVSGGLIVYADRRYWAVSDDGMTMVAKGFNTYGEAKLMCDQMGWKNGDPIKAKDFEAKFGTTFKPFEF